MEVQDEHQWYHDLAVQIWVSGRDGLNIAQVCPNMLQLLLLLQSRANRNVYIDHLPTHPRFNHLFSSNLLLGSHMTAPSCLESRNKLQRDT